MTHSAICSPRLRSGKLKRTKIFHGDNADKTIPKYGIYIRNSIPVQSCHNDEDLILLATASCYGNLPTLNQPPRVLTVAGLASIVPALSLPHTNPSSLSWSLRCLFSDHQGGYLDQIRSPNKFKVFPWASIALDLRSQKAARSLRRLLMPQSFLKFERFVLNCSTGLGGSCGSLKS